MFIFFTLSPGFSPPHSTLSNKEPVPRSILSPTSIIFSGINGSNSTHAIRRASRHWYNTAPNSSAFKSSFAIRKGSVSEMKRSTLATIPIAAIVAFGSSKSSTCRITSAAAPAVSSGQSNRSQVIRFPAVLISEGIAPSL